MSKRRSPLLIFVLLALFGSSCGFISDTGDAIVESFESLGGNDEADEVEWTVADGDDDDDDDDAAASEVRADGENIEVATDEPVDDGETETVEPEPTAVPVPTEAPTPTPTPTATPVPTAAPAPTAIVINDCVVEPTATPDPARPRYDANLTIDVPNRSVRGEMSVDFTPDQPIEAVVVRLWPNSPRLAAGGTELTVANVSVDGADARSTLVTPTRLEIALADDVNAGETITVAMTFDLTVGAERRARVAAGADFMRLGSILPTLPWQPGKGWATEPATALFAEAAMSPTADYQVQVEVTDGYDVLASGQEQTPGVWSVSAARDFALSVGQFTIVEATAMATDDVVVTVGMHSTLADDPQAYLDKVVDSLEMFAGLWGDYPWPSLTFAVTPGIGGGIEFPTHIMQGEGTLGRTTSHEVGHMFFYSLVGNNQGRSPWLDEGLASYAEFRYENFNTKVVGIPESALGVSGQPMSYFADHRSTYYNSVYLYPGVAIGDLGDPKDIDCALRRYVAANAFGIAEPADFFDAFDDIFPNVVDEFGPYGLVPELD